MTLFRPCIDIHDNKVKQIVGSTLRDTCRPQPDCGSEPTTNFTSADPPSHFGTLYRSHNLTGGHIILLGPNNTSAGLEACAAWPGTFQIGGGITAENAAWWIDHGKAGKVIVTSYLFPDEHGLRWDRLWEVFGCLGNDRSKLVIDLSCAVGPAESTNKADDSSRSDEAEPAYFVATRKWTVTTSFRVDLESLCLLAPFCSEFLIHAVAVEGLQSGIDQPLLNLLGKWARAIPSIVKLAPPLSSETPLHVRRAEIQSAIKAYESSSVASPDYRPFPITYAGGARSVADLELADKITAGAVDLTIGSALDIFGGNGVTLDECVEWNRAHQPPPS